jgi:hypothetical protein
MMSEPKCIDAINFFFSSAGPTKIIVTLETTDQPHEHITDGGSVVESFYELAVHFKELDYVPPTSVFFMKTKKDETKSKGASNGTEAERFTIDPYKYNDGTMTFGVIRSPLESLEAIMRCVYKVIKATTTCIYLLSPSYRLTSTTHPFPTPHLLTSL